MNFEVNGPGILWEIPLLGGIQVTESIVNTWVLMLLLSLAAFILTRGMRTKNPGRRQIIAETLVKTMENMVSRNAGTENMGKCAFVAALFSMGLFSGLMGVAGFFAPAADLSACTGWSLVIFAAVTAQRIRTKRLVGYFRSFAEPVAFMAPINIISEASLPVSMAFRLFGNIASGAVVMQLVRQALVALGSPVFAIGLPALLSIYFDVFASGLQAFIIAMLTMIYIRLAGE